MNRLLLVTIILVLFSSGIYAQNYNPKFDEGPDLAEFLKAVREDSPLQTCMPFPLVRFEVVKTISIKDTAAPGLSKESLKLRAGSYFGDLSAHVTGNTAHIYAVKYVPPIQSSPDPGAKELLIQWENITNARFLLLDEAQALELKDSGLYAEHEQIAQNANALNKEFESLQADIAAYNAECAGQPVSNKCTAWYNKLLAWDKDLRQRIAAHNAYLSDWRGRKKELEDSVTGWRGKLKAWEQAILGFIEKAQAFLKDTGNCKPKQHEALQQQVKDACKVPNEPYACRQWNPNDPAKDCSEWRVIYQRNIDCYNARREINQTCYDGGNPTHQDEERIAAERADTCWLLIQESCLKAIAPSIPGRRYGGGF